MKRLWLNIRIGSWHIIATRRAPFIKLNSNPTHRVGSGIDRRTGLQIGEFRNKPGWKRVAVYDFFGWHRYG